MSLTRYMGLIGVIHVVSRIIASGKVYALYVL
jgi:hypothetical protein